MRWPIAYSTLEVVAAVPMERDDSKLAHGDALERPFYEGMACKRSALVAGFEGKPPRFR